MRYRLICSLAPRWTKVPMNRFTEGEAKKRMSVWAKSGCPGKHTMELIEE
jgi:hypothetical protein